MRVFTVVLHQEPILSPDWGSCVVFCTGNPTCCIMAIRLANLSDASDIHNVHTSSIREICSKFYTEEEIKSWVSRQHEDRYKDFIKRKEIIVADNGVEVQGFGHLSERIDDKNRTSDDSQKGKMKQLFFRPVA